MAQPYDPLILKLAKDYTFNEAVSRMASQANKRAARGERPIRMTLQMVSQRASAIYQELIKQDLRNVNIPQNYTELRALTPGGVSNIWQYLNKPSKLDQLQTATDQISRNLGANLAGYGAVSPEQVGINGDALVELEPYFNEGKVAGQAAQKLFASTSIQEFMRRIKQQQKIDDADSLQALNTSYNLKDKRRKGQDATQESAKYLIPYQKKMRFQTIEAQDDFDQAAKNVRPMYDAPGVTKFQAFANIIPFYSQNFAKQQEKREKLKPTMETLKAEIQKQNSYKWKLLQQIRPGQVSWDGEQWQITPSFQQYLLKKAGLNPLFKQSSAKTRKLLDQQADEGEIMTYVPVFIRNLVDSSNTLSSSGFGPVKAGGLRWYVGRYSDPVTGRIHIFPKAKQSMINPTVRNQKLDYLKARILNQWNGLVQTNQQLMALSRQTDADYKASAVKSMNKAWENFGNGHKVFNYFKTLTYNWLLGIDIQKNASIAFDYLGRQIITKFSRRLSMNLGPEQQRNVVRSIRQTFTEALDELQPPLHNSGMQAIFQYQQLVGALSDMALKSNEDGKNLLLKQARTTLDGSNPKQIAQYTQLKNNLASYVKQRQVLSAQEMSSAKSMDLGGIASLVANPAYRSSVGGNFGALQLKSLKQTPTILTPARWTNKNVGPTPLTLKKIAERQVRQLQRLQDNMTWPKLANVLKKEIAKTQNMLSKKPGFNQTELGNDLATVMEQTFELMQSKPSVQFIGKLVKAVMPTIFDGAQGTFKKRMDDLALKYNPDPFAGEGGGEGGKGGMGMGEEQTMMQPRDGVQT